MKIQRIHTLACACCLGATLSCVSAQTHVPLPFSDGFESGSLSNVWRAISEPEGLRLRGQAVVLSNSLSLASYSRRGYAWRIEKQLVSGGFTNTFSFRMSGSSAEGLAFVVQNAALETWPDEPAGTTGPGYGGITNCLVVEFDSSGAGGWYEPSSEPTNQHVAVLCAGSSPATYDHTNALVETTNIPTLNDGAVHTARVVYTSGTMDVYLDNLATPVLSKNLNIDTLLTLDNGKAWVGFTARATSQRHEILNWEFSTSSAHFIYSGFSTPRSRIAVTNGFGSVDGTYHLVMDDPATPDIPCGNVLDLPLNLNGMSNVWIHYWWKVPEGEPPYIPCDYHGLYHDYMATNAIVASSDGGTTWYSMAPLPDRGAATNGYVERFIFLDESISSYSYFNWTSNFFLRFQQNGCGAFPEHGMALDGIEIYKASRPVGRYPFFDGFDDGVKHGWWSDVWPCGHTHGGYCLVGLGNYRDTLTVNLAGQTNVWLSFKCLNYNDDWDQIMPDTYTGTVDADGAAVSVDGGTTWYKVQGLTTNEGLLNDNSYHLFNLNLSAVLDAHGLSFSTNTMIQFVHHMPERAHHCLDDVSLLAQEINVQDTTLSTVEGTSLTVTVVRTGCSAGTVTVDYTTSNLTAIADEDYTAQSGTLTFADGVTSQNIVIPITDDTEYYESNETFRVLISNATGGAKLGNLTQTEVTIIRDARAPFPFVEGFENINPNTYDDNPGFYWFSDGSYNGYFARIGDTLCPHSGSRDMRIYSGISGATNWTRATLTINLLNQTNVVLKFWHKTSDSYDAMMPTSFTGTNFSDGVAISVDGFHWYKAAGLTSGEGATTNYQQYTVDLDSLVASNGITYNKDFRICFQAYDIPGGASCFDDISVYSDYGPLTITTTNLPNAVSMTPYSTGLAGTNGLPPYSWNTTSILPAGMNLSSIGTLSGTPSDEGGFDLDIQLTDAAGNFTNRPLHLEIAPNSNRPPQISATNPPESNLAIPENSNCVFSVTATDPEGTNLTYSWILDGTPIGTDSNRFVLTTDWGDTGTYQLGVTVSDGLWSNVCVTWNITVLDDNDGDGMPNAWERTYQLDPWNSADADDDPDADGLSNLGEYQNGTNPQVADSDGDTLPDGWEVTHSLNPLDAPGGIPDVQLTLLGSRDMGWYIYDLAVSNNYAYLAMTEGLVIAGVADPASISGPWSCTMSNAAQAVALSSNMAYIATGYDGLKLVNVADPEHPVVVGEFDTEGNSSDVVALGNRVYLADGNNGLLALDVSTSTNPIKVAELAGINSTSLALDPPDTLYTVNGSVIYSVDLDTGNYLQELGHASSLAQRLPHDLSRHVVECPAGYDGIQTLDLRTSSDPRVAATESIPESPTASCASGTLVFIGATDSQTASSGLIYSRRTDDPFHPLTVATNILAHGPNCMTVISNRLYVGTSAGELLIYAINETDTDQDGLPDSWEMQHFGNLNQNDTNDPDGDGIGNLGEYRAGLDPLDDDTDGDSIRDGDEIRLGGDPGGGPQLLSITRLATLDTPGSAQAVAFADNGIACVADGTNGLVIVDISDPSSPEMVGHFLGMDSAVDVVVQSNLAFFADSTGGVFKIDISMPTNPVGLVRYYDNSDWNAIAVESNLCAYLPQNNFSVQFGLVDVAVDVAQTNAWRGTLSLPTPANDVALRGQYAYLARSVGSSSVVSVVDISDPAVPALIQDTDLQSDQSPEAICLDGAHAYVALESGGTRLLDISDPAAPVQAGSYAGSPDAFARDICATDNLAFIVYESNVWDSCQSFGLEIVDVGDPSNPNLLVRTNAFTQGFGVAATTNLALVAAGTDGLVLFRYQILDRDKDGLDDAWEIRYFGSLAPSGGDDPDGDGINNLGEFEYAFSPTNSDQDADGMADGWEILHRFAVGSADGNLDADADGVPNASEYVADTDPRDASDYFSILAFSNAVPATLYFNSSAARLYWLEGCTNLFERNWQVVPGAEPRQGIGGADFLEDTNPAPPAIFYRLKVETPE